MSETTPSKRGGRAYHSVLEPHFDFIQQLRQRRKTWKEIAELLFTEKGVRVTLYAPVKTIRCIQRDADAFLGEQQFGNFFPCLASLAQLVNEIEMRFHDAVERPAAAFAWCHLGHHCRE